MAPEKLSARLADHPTVRKVLSRKTEKPGVIDADWVRQVCLDAGADDVAFASVENPELAGEREYVDAALPGTLSYISLVVKMNRDNVRSTARSVANQEFHRSGEIMNEAAHRITRALQDAGYRAINPSMSFPMEMDRFPGRIWVVAHKPVAVAAGLGVMGIHRNVIHPKFGNFILLGTILVAAPVSSYGEPLDYSPCLECKLCVAARPGGAPKRNAPSTSSPGRCQTSPSSWAGSPTGCRPSPTAPTPTISARASAIPRMRRCGRARLSRRTTRRRTAWRCVPQARMSSSPISTTARDSWIWCSSRCRRRRKRCTCCRIRRPRRTPNVVTRTSR